MMKLGFEFLDIVQYRLRSPHSPLLAVPFPRWGTLMVRSNSFDIQRTSDIAIILFRQIGIFYLDYFALVIEFVQTFSIKYSNLICKIITLNHLR